MTIIQREEAHQAYDNIDCYLRDNLDDADYAEFSAALELVYDYEATNDAVPQEPSSDDVRDKRIAEWKSSYDAKCVENTANFLRAEKAEAALVDALATIVKRQQKEWDDCDAVEPYKHWFIKSLRELHAAITGRGHD